LSKLSTNRRILIVGEGRETEYNYFVGFRNAFEDVLKATATSVSVARGKGGDARAIVTNAIKERKKFQPVSKLGDRVFLLLDTEGTGRSPGQGRTPELPAAEILAKKSDIEIVYSCPSFEYWFLCHFANATRGQFANCAAVITALNKKWISVSQAAYDKTDVGVYKRLSGSLDIARAQSLKIDLHHIATSGSAFRVNPSTQVYKLVAILIGVKSGEKCPLAGTWKLRGNASVTHESLLGDLMPQHEGSVVYWHL
jgi:hypothetical protein